MRVRAATVRDVPAIAAMRLALITEERHGTPLPASAERRARRLSAVHVRGGGEITLLAVVGAQIVGTMRCTEAGGASVLSGDRHAAITSVFVRPGFRRRGVVRALLNAAEAWCQERAIAELRLHCAIDNADGNAAWSALGFVPWEVRYRRPVSPR